MTFSFHVAAGCSFFCTVNRFRPVADRTPVTRRRRGRPMPRPRHWRDRARAVDDNGEEEEIIV